MSNELPEDLRRILTAQTKVNPPRSITLPVLPKIGPSITKRSSTQSLNKATSSKKESVEPISLPRLTDDMDNMSLVARRTPIVDAGVNGDDLKFNYSFIPNHEILRSTNSTAHGSGGGSLIANAVVAPFDFDRTFVIRRDTPHPSHDSISLLDLKLASIPQSLPDMVGLQNAVDNLSSHRIASILDACRLYDRELRGYLSVPSLIKCFGEVVPSVHSRSSPWRLFLHSLAPDGEFVEYEKLLELVERHRPKGHIVETIPDLIVSSEDGKAVALIKPSTGQENRERTRAQCQVITELEVLLMRNPELTLDRLKTATTKQTIELSEFKMLLELYGLETHFQPFYQRLVSCFLTHDNKFHFSAFVGCLSLVRPPVRQSAGAAPPTPLWNKAPLAPIGKTKANTEKN
ncbi:hypothetical protein Aduo_004946 [Ancylostoma duodenale]